MAAGLGVAPVAFGADTGDTGADTCNGVEPSRTEGAVYDDRTCVSGDVAAAFCGYWPLPDGDCPTWEEMLAYWPVDEVYDCDAAGDFAHVATFYITEWNGLFGFNVDGALVAGEVNHGNGMPWCCEGQETYSIEAGPVDGTCPNPTPHWGPDTGEDTASTDDTAAADDATSADGCGCGGVRSSSVAAGAALLLVLTGGSARRRRR